MNKNKSVLTVLYPLLGIIVVCFLLSLVLVISTSTGTEVSILMDTVLELVSMLSGGF